MILVIHIFFFLVNLARGLLILFIFSKNQLLILLIFFIDFCSNVCYWFSSAYFEFNLLLFFYFPKVEVKVIDFRSFLFSNIYSQCYKFPSKHWFCCITQILNSCFFHLIQNIFKFVWQHVVFRNVLFKVVWLSGVSTRLQTKRWLVRFLVMAHAWVAGQVPGWVCVRGNRSIPLLCINVSLHLSVPSFPSL